MPVERLLREHLVGSGRGAATSGAAASGAHTAARGNGAQTSALPLFCVNVAVFLWSTNFEAVRYDGNGILHTDPAIALEQIKDRSRGRTSDEACQLATTHLRRRRCRRAPSRSAPSRKALLTHSAPHAQRSFTHASRLAPCPLVLLTRPLALTPLAPTTCHHFGPLHSTHSHPTRAPRQFSCLTCTTSPRSRRSRR